MEILSVFDSAFKPYGKVVTGMEDTCKEILTALEKTPLPEGTGYVPSEPLLQNLLIAVDPILFQQGGHEKALPIVENAMGQKVDAQAQPHQQHENAAEQQRRADIGTDTDSQNAQNAQSDPKNAVALIDPHSQTGLVLDLTAEGFGKSFVYQPAGTKYSGDKQCDHQNSHANASFL